jgi:hypothetical protein
MVPVVTGHVDQAALDYLTDLFLAGHSQPAACGRTCETCTCATAQTGPTGKTSTTSENGATGQPLPAGSRPRLRNALLALATDALSGPGGLAAQLRAGLGGGPLATVSLPLDIGPASETIPVHLRRAVIARHGHCAFPGCDQPASVCDTRHLTPRAEGGPTALRNLVPMLVPPQDRHPPLGLDPDPAPRRHHHRHQPPRPHTAQSRPTRPGPRPTRRHPWPGRPGSRAAQPRRLIP